MDNNILADYLRLGYQLLPLEPNAKQPLTRLVPNGLKQASANPETLAQWANSAPTANWGLLPPANVLVLDLDEPERWPTLLDAYPELGTAPRQRTPRGGYHLFLRLPDEAIGLISASTRKLPGCDVRGLGRAYLAVAPSTIDGTAYTWEQELVGVSDLPEVPPGLLSQLLPPPPPPPPAPRSAPMPVGDERLQKRLRGLLGWACGRVASTPKGARHNTLLQQARLVGGWLHHGLDEAEALEALTAAGMAAGLPEAEARATARDGLADGRQDPLDLPPDDSPPVAVGRLRSAATDDWPEPEPLDALEPPTIPDFDAQALLPEPLSPWVVESAERMCAPVEFLGTATLVAVAGVVGNRVLVAPDPEANPGWFEAPNLWGLLVGEPGTKKSPTMERAFAPLHSIEADLHKENQRRRDEWELARRNRKKGDPLTEDDLHPPAERAVLTHDITPEKLAELLEHNPYGLVGYQDELLGLIATWERPEKAGERQFYLKLWNGLSPHTVRRIQRGSHYIPICTLSLLGGAQPGPLSRYILEAAKGWSNDGLLQRFQLLVQAELPEYRRVVKPPLSVDTAYDNLFHNLPVVLDALGKTRPVVRVRHDVERPVLTFDAEALVLYLQWLEDSARESRQPTTPTLKRSLIEKQAGLVPKLALLIELVGSLGGSPHISTLSTARAIALANLYRAHTLAVWWSALKPELEGAVLLAKRIRERVKTKSAFDYQRITVRDVVRANWRGLTDPRAIEGALAELEARGWLRREGNAWTPNPRIWE